MPSSTTWSPGGAKRALYNLSKQLIKAGHVVDAFTPASADETFLPMKEVANKYQVFPKRRTLLGNASAVLRRMGHLGTSWIDHEGTQKYIAKVINAGSYDVVLSEQDFYTLSPFILKFLTGSVVYYCQQPDRMQEAFLAEVSRPIATEGLLGWWRKRQDWYFSRQANQLDRDNARFAS